MDSKFLLVAFAAVLVLFVGSTQAAAPATRVGSNYTSIIVGGMVFCSSCKGPGYVDYLNATPVSDVVVRVSCFGFDGKLYSKSVNTKGGFFYLEWTMNAIFDPYYCRAYADWSPSTCNVPKYYPGTYGAYLYLVEDKAVSGGRQGSFSPGVIFMNLAQGATCPTKY